MDQWARKDANSVLTQHSLEVHSDDCNETEYIMKLINRHRSNLSRQVEESVLIENFNGHTLLNRKGEWGCNAPAGLVLDSDADSTSRKRARMRRPDPERLEETERRHEDQPKRKKEPLQPIRVARVARR